MGSGELMVGFAHTCFNIYDKGHRTRGCPMTLFVVFYNLNVKQMERCMIITTPHSSLLQLPHHLFDMRQVVHGVAATVRVHARIVNAAIRPVAVIAEFRDHALVEAVEVGDVE